MPPDKSPQMMATYWSNFLPNSFKVQFHENSNRYQIYEKDYPLKGTMRSVEEVKDWRHPVRVWCHILKRFRKDRGDENWNLR